MNASRRNPGRAGRFTDGNISRFEMPVFSAVPNTANREAGNNAVDRNAPGPSVLSRVSTHSTRLGELEKKIQRLETNLEGVDRIPESDSDNEEAGDK